MPYNQQLAQRVRSILGECPGFIAKKMFGGVGFMLHGNMACGVLGDSLIVRVGAENHHTALARPFTKPFQVAGHKPMTGWVMVDLQALTSDQELKEWVELGYTHAFSLPAKG